MIFKASFPVSLASGPHGELFVAEKRGSIAYIRNDTVVAETIVNIPVESCCEHGLLGIAIDPDFEMNPYIYTYYTVPYENHNRVSRFHFHKDELRLEHEEILIELERLNGEFHSGGSLAFGPDGKLYIGTGDGSYAPNSPNRFSLLGKILRINPDGTIPTDNPFYETSNGVYRAVYAYGLRNPFTLSFNEDGRLFVNDVGNAAYEEVNEVFAGNNYGWPSVEGKLPEGDRMPDNYDDPVFLYSHDVGCAITGSAFYPSSNHAFPEFYQGKYFFGDYCSAVIKVLDPQTFQAYDFITNATSPIAISVSNKGELYYVNVWDKEVWKVFYASDGSPRVTLQPKSQISVAGDTVEFVTSAAGDEPLNYQWTINGQPVEAATSKSLRIDAISTDLNGSTISCSVSNDKGVTETQPALLTVTTRKRPVSSIDLSDITLPYKAGDTIIIQGLATDEIHGVLPPSSLTWRVDFHHNTHIHPVITSQSGTDSIGFVVPRTGETSSNVWYRIYLTSKNDINLEGTLYREIFPAISTFTVESTTDSLILFLDGKPIPAPFTVTGVIGTTRNLIAEEAQYHQDSVYYFSRWNDHSSFETSLTFNVPERDTTYIASYSHEFLGDGLGLTADYFNVPKAFDTIPALTRIDTLIAFDWGPYAPDQSVRAENFSGRWTGYIKVPYTDTYNFHILADDASQLIIDSTLVIDDMGDAHGLRELTGIKFLRSGQLYPITLKYSDLGGGAIIKLSWSSTRIQKSLVPVRVLFPYYFTPQITVTGVDQKFAIGKPLTYEASARGPRNRAIESENFRWNMALVDSSERTDISNKTGLNSISFQIPEDYYSRVGSTIESTLIVSDRNGFTDTLKIQSFPQVANLQIHSTDSSMLFKLNENAFHVPLDTSFVSGFTFDITAPNTKVTDETLFYAEDHWRSGSHSFVLRNDTILHLDYNRMALDNGNGLTAKYFSLLKTFDSVPDSVKIAGQVNEVLSVNDSKVSKIRWSGWLTPPEEGFYSIKVNTNDVASVRIEKDIFVIVNGTISSDENPIYLHKGGFYPLEVSYEYGGIQDEVSLTWQSNLLPEHVIPRKQLFTDLPPENEIAKIFPNPFDDFIHVKLANFNATSPVQLTLSNSIGEILFQSVLTPDNTIDIPAHALAKGFYLLRIQIQNQERTFKLVKH